MEINLVHFKTRSSAGILPATKIWEQDAPTTFKTMVLKIDVV
jgi:hypothetical protein